MRTRVAYFKTGNELFTNDFVAQRVLVSGYIQPIPSEEQGWVWKIVNEKGEVLHCGTTQTLLKAKEHVKTALVISGVIFDEEIRKRQSYNNNLEIVMED